MKKLHLIAFAIAVAPIAIGERLRSRVVKKVKKPSTTTLLARRSTNYWA